jgi:hypothetical protein
MDKLEEVIAWIDEVNSQDPNSEEFDNQAFPKEILYSIRLTDWLLRLEPNPSEELQIAARAQHICRWEIPRSEYPMDRKGYLKWRTMLKLFHADKAGELMLGVGYTEDRIKRVQSLIKKEKLKTDHETQLLEDVVCLVFLENYFSDFRADHPDEKIIDIVQKTWGKMSNKGHLEALKLSLQKKSQGWVEGPLGGGRKGKKGRGTVWGGATTEDLAVYCFTLQDCHYHHNRSAPMNDDLLLVEMPD